MDFEDYKLAMDSGEQKAKYVRCADKELKNQWDRIKKVVEEGQQQGFISESDAKVMIPEKPVPGRLYGLAKDHKPVPPGSNIPKLRDVISGSGSNRVH